MQQAYPNSPLAKIFEQELQRKDLPLEPTSRMLHSIFFNNRALASSSLLEKVKPLAPFIVKEIKKTYRGPIKNLPPITNASSSQAITAYDNKVTLLLTPVLNHLCTLLIKIDQLTSSENSFKKFFTLTKAFGIDVASYVSARAPIIINQDFTNNQLVMELILPQIRQIQREENFDMLHNQQCAGEEYTHYCERKRLAYQEKVCIPLLRFMNTLSSFLTTSLEPSILELAQACQNRFPFPASFYELINLFREANLLDSSDDEVNILSIQFITAFCQNRKLSMNPNMILGLGRLKAVGIAKDYLQSKDKEQHSLLLSAICHFSNTNSIIELFKQRNILKQHFYRFPNVLNFVVRLCNQLIRNARGFPVSIPLEKLLNQLYSIYTNRQRPDLFIALMKHFENDLALTPQKTIQYHDYLSFPVIEKFLAIIEQNGDALGVGSTFTKVRLEIAEPRVRSELARYYEKDEVNNFWRPEISHLRFLETLIQLLKTLEYSHQHRILPKLLDHLVSHEFEGYYDFLKNSLALLRENDFKHRLQNPHSLWILQNFAVDHIKSMQTLIHRIDPSAFNDKNWIATFNILRRIRNPHWILQGIPDNIRLSVESLGFLQNIETDPRRLNLNSWEWLQLFKRGRFPISVPTRSFVKLAVSIKFFELLGNLCNAYARLSDALYPEEAKDGITRILSFCELRTVDEIKIYADLRPSGTEDSIALDLKVADTPFILIKEIDNSLRIVKEKIITVDNLSYHALVSSFMPSPVTVMNEEDGVRERDLFDFLRALQALIDQDLNPSIYFDLFCNLFSTFHELGIGMPSAADPQISTLLSELFDRTVGHYCLKNPSDKIIRNIFHTYTILSSMIPEIDLVGRCESYDRFVAKITPERFRQALGIDQSWSVGEETSLARKSIFAKENVEVVNGAASTSAARL